MNLFSVSCLLCALLAASVVHTDAKSDVIPLNYKNLRDNIAGSDHLWIVEFFAPWCGHCKKLAPEYEKAATNLKGLVKLGAVDCDQEQQLCGGFDVKGFPTIKVFKPAGNPTTPPTPEDYQGPRTAAGIANYATSMMPSYVQTVTTKNHDSFLEKNSEIASVFLFTEKDKTSSLYKGLSAEYKGRLALGEIKKSQKELVEQYEVESFPTLMVVQQDGTRKVFEGKLSFDSLKEFLDTFAPSKKTEGSSQSDSSAPPPKLAKTEVTYTDTLESFKDNCLSFKLCVIGFLSEENTGPELHQTFQNILSDLAKRQHRSFSVVWLDGVKHYDMMQFFTLESGFPAIAVIHHEKQLYSPYIGSFEADKISLFLDKLLRGVKSTAPFRGDFEPLLATFDQE